MAVMVGRSSARTWLALLLCTCRAAAPISAKRSAETRRPPSFVPRAFAEARAALVLFTQGAAVSGSLIAQAQYMKAASALKQDIELLARFREAVEERAVQGKTPQMSFAPKWARRAYGELNKIAHPSNFEEMHSVLSFPNGAF